MHRLTVILGGVLFAMCLYYLLLLVKDKHKNRRL